ncbi:MAG: glycosyltransferase family 4 protein, partial [Candidatus Bathyarchaeia archaeon]
WRCWLNPAMGGAEVFTREVLKRWADQGHQIVLFTSQFKGSKREENIDGVKIIRAGGSYMVYRQAKKFYKNRFAKEKYDVIIDEINTRPFHTPSFAKNGEKIVALIHQLAKEYWFYETPFPISFLGYYFLESEWLKPYQRFPTVTVSDSTRRDLTELGFEKTFVVGEGLNFAPLSQLSEKEKHPSLVYAGRLKKAKRPEHAIKAFRIIKETIPDAELWMIGDGYLRKKLAKMACEGVKFFPSLSNEERRRLIARSWVLVNPSVREGFGLNIIEANALGVPCIAYDVPGLRDAIINGETGFIVEPGNPKALADCVLNILNNDALRIELSKKALLQSSKFSWDDVADRFGKIIKYYHTL